MITLSPLIGVFVHAILHLSSKSVLKIDYVSIFTGHIVATRSAQNIDSSASLEYDQIVSDLRGCLRLLRIEFCQLLIIQV